MGLEMDERYSGDEAAGQALNSIQPQNNPSKRYIDSIFLDQEYHAVYKSIKASNRNNRHAKMSPMLELLSAVCSRASFNWKIRRSVHSSQMCSINSQDPNLLSGASLLLVFHARPTMSKQVSETEKWCLPSLPIWFSIKP